MTRAVIFDMFETLITHYKSPLYFGTQMAADANIPPERFLPRWRATERDRSLGRRTLEDVLEEILRAEGRYSPELFRAMPQKRTAIVASCFDRMHPEIWPMLDELKRRGCMLGLISNCFSEEAAVIRRSTLIDRFDGVYLSYEQGTAKPDPEIYLRCMQGFGVTAEECLYIGDGGSRELETARALGMTAVQARWYLQPGTSQQSGPKDDFPYADRPLDVLRFL